MLFYVVIRADHRARHRDRGHLDDRGHHREHQRERRDEGHQSPHSLHHRGVDRRDEIRVRRLDEHRDHR